MESESSKSQRKCPGCGADKVGRSRRTGVDYLLYAFGRRPFRCRSCGKRFYIAGESGPAKRNGRRESAARRQASRRRELLVYSFAMVAFVFIVFVITLEQ